MNHLEKFKKLGIYEKKLSLALFILLIAFGFYIIILLSILDKPGDSFYGLSTFIGEIVGGGLIAYSLLLGVFLLSSYRCRDSDKAGYIALSIVFIFLGLFYAYFDLMFLLENGNRFNDIMTLIFLLLTLIVCILLVFIKIISMIYKDDSK